MLAALGVVCAALETSPLWMGKTRICEQCTRQGMSKVEQRIIRKEV